MRFSDELWKHTLPIYQEIVTHPFNVELASGTLSQERFQFYMRQDAHYLVHFSKALALIAARSNAPRVIQLFLKFSSGALLAERELHAHFLGQLCDDDPLSPTCLGYTQYLIAIAATGSVEEAIAAVLPCFWIYREIGRSIYDYAEKNNPYALWIQTYASQEFSDATDEAICLLNEAAEHCSSHQQMKKAFETSALYEWHFWNDSHDMTLFDQFRGVTKLVNLDIPTRKTR